MQQLLTPSILPIPAGQDHQSTSWAVLKLLPHLHHFTLEHPDVIWVNQEGESLGIEEVRALQELLGYGAYQTQGRLVVILHADTASIPAQNALLKVLEEPPANTHLVLTATQPDTFLPTVLSRCVMLKSPSETLAAPSTLETADVPPATLPEDLLTLLDTPAAIPFHQVIQLSDQFSDRTEAIRVLEHMLGRGHDQLRSGQVTPQRTQQLQILLEGVSWLKRNANVKLALGECFLRLKKVTSA